MSEKQEKLELSVKMDVEATKLQRKFRAIAKHLEALAKELEELEKDEEE